MNQMDQQPQPAPQGGANRDGLAAVAIALLAVAIIVLAIIAIV
jgi:hypothetical protein